MGGEGSACVTHRVRELTAGRHRPGLLMLRAGGSPCNGAHNSLLASLLGAPWRLTCHRSGSLCPAVAQLMVSITPSRTQDSLLLCDSALQPAHFSSPLLGVCQCLSGQAVLLPCQAVLHSTSRAVPLPQWGIQACPLLQAPAQGPYALQLESTYSLVATSLHSLLLTSSVPLPIRVYLPVRASFAFPGLLPRPCNL